MKSFLSVFFAAVVTFVFYSFIFAIDYLLAMIPLQLPNFMPEKVFDYQQRFAIFFGIPLLLSWVVIMVSFHLIRDSGVKKFLGAMLKNRWLYVRSFMILVAITCCLSGIAFLALWEYSFEISFALIVLWPLIYFVMIIDLLIMRNALAGKSKLKPPKMLEEKYKNEDLFKSCSGSFKRADL